MSEYRAPLKDMSFVMKHVVGIERIGKLPGCEEVTADLVDAIFEEAGKFSGNVLSPINRSGDIEGARWSNGTVTTPKGFKDAYQKYVDGGWPAWGTVLKQGNGDAALSWEGWRAQWKGQGLDFDYFLGRWFFYYRPRPGIDQQFTYKSTFSVGIHDMNWNTPTRMFSIE